MRLLSLYGSPDRSLEFRVNAYSDGSGSDSPVVFFKSKEDALIFMQNEFNGIKEYSISYLETAEKYGLKTDDEKLNTYLEKVKEQVKKSILETELQLEKQQKELEEISNKSK